MAIQVKKPFVEWLLANNINIETTPAWAELDVVDGTIHIEQLWHHVDEQGERHPQRIGDELATTIVQFPLRQPMPPGLDDAYRRAAAEGRQTMRLRRFASMLSSGWACTVVTPASQDRLVFVTQDNQSRRNMRQLLADLESALPGVKISVVSGMRAILIQHNAADDIDHPVLDKW